MKRRLLASYLGLAVLVLAVLEIPLGIVNARTERSDLTTKVERDASFLAAFAEDALENNRRPLGLAAQAINYSKDTGARVVVVDRHGVAVVDTSPLAGGPRTFASRPEIKTALRGVIATGVRYSKTLHKNLLYIAVPASSGAKVTGAVRITYPTSAADARVRRYWLMLLAISGLVLAAAAVSGLRFASWVTAPLGRLEVAAREGAGDLTIRADETAGPPEVRSLAGAFNRMIGELEKLVRSQKDFVADASHQLRTPLTALRLRLENLAHADSGGRADLERALAEVERLSDLVDGLLALARAEVPAPELIDLGGLVAERLEAWSALAQERGVRVVCDVTGTVTAARDRAEQVLENLLANALEVSPKGSTITVKGSGGELRVCDRGPGMTAQERSRAFDRFWRGTKSGGSGLGLAIVKRLVEIDGGSVELREAAGGGLEAVVSFRPAAPE